MKNSRFPSLVDLALNATVSSGSPSRAMSRDQREAQEELREKSRGLSLGSAILPWYSTPEARDVTATGTTSVTGDQGGKTIGTDVPEIGAALRANLVLEKLGARVFGGLQGDADFPRAKADLTCQWLRENAQSTDSSNTFGTLSLTPHRLVASVPVSTQWLIQNPTTADTFLTVELMCALAVEIQRVLIAGSGGSGEPTGILSTTGVAAVYAGGATSNGTNTAGAAPAFADLCNLEYAVTGTGKADRGNLAFLASPLARKKMRQTPILASTDARMLWDRDAAYSLLGYPAGVAPSVPDNLSKGASSGILSALIFGEMSELIIGLWGPGIGVEAVRAGTHKEGKVLMLATAYVDGGLRCPEAFAKCIDLNCQ